MLNKDGKKYLSNPILGLLPFLLYLAVYYFTQNTIWGLLSCLALSAVLDILVRFYTKSTVCGLMFWVTMIVSVLTLLTKALLDNRIHSEDAYPVFFEMFFVFILLTIRLLKPYFFKKWFKSRISIERVYINEFFNVAGIIQYFLILHIFATLVIKYIDGVSPALQAYLYTWTPVWVILSLMFFQGLKIRKLAERLRLEKWLPIVNERGEVSGRIAYSESKKRGNRFIHPILRIAIICDNKIYLQERGSQEDIDPGKLDHPFENFILYDEDINLSARDMLSSIHGNNATIRPNFSFKYIFENNDVRRLVF